MEWMQRYMSGFWTSYTRHLYNPKPDIQDICITQSQTNKYPLYTISVYSSRERIGFYADIQIVFETANARLKKQIKKTNILRIFLC